MNLVKLLEPTAFTSKQLIFLFLQNARCMMVDRSSPAKTLETAAPDRKERMEKSSRPRLPENTEAVGVRCLLKLVKVKPSQKVLESLPPTSARSAAEDFSPESVQSPDPCPESAT